MARSEAEMSELHEAANFYKSIQLELSEMLERLGSMKIRSDAYATKIDYLELSPVTIGVSESIEQLGLTLAESILTEKACNDELG